MTVEMKDLNLIELIIIGKRIKNVDGQYIFR